MPSATSTAPALHRTTSSATRGRAGRVLTRHVRSCLPWQPRRLARLLVLGLAAWLALGPTMTASAAAQQVAPAALPVHVQPAAQQVNPNPLYTPTPTPTPTPGGIAVRPDQVTIQQTPVTVRQPPVTIQQGPVTIETIPFTIQPITINPPVLPEQLTGEGQLIGVPQGPIRVVGCGSPDYIFQGCSIAPAGATEPERRLEAQAIASVLQQYQLPDSERQRVLRYARDEVRAALFARLLEAFQKEPGARDADERLLVEVFTRRVREKHVEATTSAQDWYRLWEADPCNFQPPPGFSYPARGACMGLAQAFRPASPGFDAFQAYGAWSVYRTQQDDPEIARVTGATSMGALAGYGLATAVGAGVAAGLVGALVPGAAVGAVGALLPNMAWNLGVPAIVAAGGSISSGGTVISATGATMTIADVAAAGATAPGGVSGAIALAGPVTIVLAAVTTAIVAGISVFEEAAIPDKLQEAIDKAKTYDVGAALRGDDPEVRTAAQRELFAEFITTTLPDFPGTDPAPAAQAGDPRLVVQGSPVEWLQYTAGDGSQRAVRLSGRWFADRAGSAGPGEARLTLEITYQDANEAVWTAARVGNQFVIVRVGDPAAPDYPAPRQSPELAVVDWSGRAVTARVGG